MNAPATTVTERNPTREGGITRTLSEHLVGLQFSDIPADAIESLKIFTLECVGHMVHALPQPVSRLLVNYARELGAAPQSVVVGSGFRTSAAEAAYVNASLAHADELESYGALPGTCLIPPIATALAVGELEGSSGRDFLTAVIAGVEMQGRLGVAGIGACDRGFMGISLVGPGGAGVTAGRLLGLTTEQMQHCLGVALPLGNGSTRGCGTMAHVHEAGVPARTGVFAAQVARQGFTGCADFLDGDYSWGEQYAAGGNRPYDPDALTADLDGELFFVQARIAPKRYGSCGLTHQSIHGTIEILREHDLSPDDIESIDVLVPTFADRIAPYRDPQNGEQAKFSIRQGVAGLLVGGIPELPYTDAFYDSSAQDPRYVAARERVTITVDNTANVRGFADQTLTVRLRDGRTLTKVVPNLQSTQPALVDRITMARRTLAPLGAEATDRIVDLVLNLEQHSVRDLSAALLGPTR
ncbi:MmgE/PrpD family protein [Sporichthya brevicatena]|uniref:MmgE/PrpD family protein n=1 Tax=Sporichthya brevicatena TaxID=171442 RepID=A0ABP3RCK8_9ACTN